jgi:hypothetical protein
MANVLSPDSAAKMKIARWIVDEGSITQVYNLRTNSSSLLVAGAMNDYGAIQPVARALGITTQSCSIPQKGRLPMHSIRVQGAKAYALLGLLAEELVGLKAGEARAALSFFPACGLVKDKVTTDVYMGEVWREFARESVEAWNEKKRNKLTPRQVDDIVEAWVLNRTARARRGLSRDRPTKKISGAETSQAGLVIDRDSASL